MFSLYSNFNRDYDLGDLWFVMAKPQYIEGIDPLSIYMHAIGFHTAENSLGNLTLGPNAQLGAQVVRPAMVISALTSELFLKCLVCLETTRTPKGHHLFELFQLLTPGTRSRIVGSLGHVCCSSA